MAIPGPLNGVNGVNGVPGIQPTSGQVRANANDDGNAFAKTLMNYVNNVDSQQHSSANAIQDLLTGKTKEIMPVVAEVARADLSFKLLLGVRNKVIEAYKQTINMQL